MMTMYAMYTILMALVLVDILNVLSSALPAGSASSQWTLSACAAAIALLFNYVVSLQKTITALQAENSRLSVLAASQVAQSTSTAKDDDLQQHSLPAELASLKVRLRGTEALIPAAAGSESSFGDSTPAGPGTPVRTSGDAEPVTGPVITSSTGCEAEFNHDPDFQPLAELAEMGVFFEKFQTKHLYEARYMVGSVKGVLRKLPDKKAAIKFLRTTWPALAVEKWEVCKAMIKFERKLRKLLTILKEFKITQDMKSSDLSFTLRHNLLIEAKALYRELQFDWDKLERRAAEAGLPSWPAAVADLVDQTNQELSRLGGGFLAFITTQVNSMKPLRPGCTAAHVMQQRRCQWELMKQGLKLMEDLELVVGASLDAATAAAWQKFQAHAREMQEAVQSC